MLLARWGGPGRVLLSSRSYVANANQSLVYNRNRCLKAYLAASLEGVATHVGFRQRVDVPVSRM
jgi:hypothetical protein